MIRTPDSYLAPPCRDTDTVRHTSTTSVSIVAAVSCYRRSVRDDYDFVIEALRAGRLTELEELTQLLPDFPFGEDKFIGRRWIRNAIDVGALATVEWMLQKGVDLSFQDAEGLLVVRGSLEVRCQRSSAGIRCPARSGRGY